MSRYTSCEGVYVNIYVFTCINICVLCIYKIMYIYMCINIKRREVSFLSTSKEMQLHVATHMLSIERICRIFLCNTCQKNKVFQNIWHIQAQFSSFPAFFHSCFFQQNHTYRNPWQNPSAVYRFNPPLRCRHLGLLDGKAVKRSQALLRRTS